MVGGIEGERGGGEGNVESIKDRQREGKGGNGRRRKGEREGLRRLQTKVYGGGRVENNT